MVRPDRDSSAQLIDRLLADAGFRERFRRDAAGALREVGIEGPPDELSATAGKAMETLEIRESRSSLAGVVLAGAIEALAVAGLAHHAEVASGSVTPARASAVDELPSEASNQGELAPSGGAAGSGAHELSDSSASGHAPHSEAGVDSQGEEGEESEESEESEEQEEREEHEDHDEHDEHEEDDEREEGDEGSGSEEGNEGNPGSKGDNGNRGGNIGGSEESEGEERSATHGDALDSQSSELSGVASTYPGDNAPPARIAAWMGAEAHRRGLPSQLPVMAALVESNLKNLKYGDADSVGYFQVRLGIWDTGKYAGYPSNPKLQLQWFLDQAEAVKRQRVADGESVSDPKQYGEWIADVERPAAQYRGRYQLQLQAAEALLRKGGRASQNGSSAVQELDAVRPGTQGHLGGHTLQAMIDRAELVARDHPPYLWGGGHGSEPAPLGSPVDCSGFVAQVLGVRPRVSGEFAEYGLPGPGRQVTIYANSEHVFIKLGDRWYSTSDSNPGGGAGRISPPSPSYLQLFKARHPPGM